MSDYKMDQYQLQSYFKSLCNSFYIAYDQVKRLEKEDERLANDYNEEDLETVKSLLETECCSNKYLTLNYSREELEKEQERLEAEKQEYERKSEELGQIFSYWEYQMWKEYYAIESVLYRIKNEDFTIIVTTKQEIYALMLFYSKNAVKRCPVVNLEEDGKRAFPTGEELYDSFIFAYEEVLIHSESEYIMNLLYDKYF